MGDLGVFNYCDLPALFVTKSWYYFIIKRFMADAV